MKLPSNIKFEKNWGDSIGLVFNEDRVIFLNDGKLRISDSYPYKTIPAKELELVKIKKPKAGMWVVVGIGDEPVLESITNYRLYETAYEYWSVNNWGDIGKLGDPGASSYYELREVKE